MNFLKRIFTSKKKLLQQLEKTNQQLTDCSNALLKKQEVINETNAYWKRKMYVLKNNSKKKKEL
jgi:hypothetical protein